MLYPLLWHPGVFHGLTGASCSSPVPIPLPQLSSFSKLAYLSLSLRHPLLFWPHMFVHILPSEWNVLLLVQFLTGFSRFFRLGSNPVSPWSLFCPSQHKVTSASLNFCSTIHWKVTTHNFVAFFMLLSPVLKILYYFACHYLSSKQMDGSLYLYYIYKLLEGRDQTLYFLAFPKIILRQVPSS